MTERALYILRLTNLAHGDGIGEPDHMYLVGPFADGFQRANFISRYNPEARPGWVPVSGPSGLRLVGLPVFHPDDEELYDARATETR